MAFLGRLCNQAWKCGVLGHVGAQLLGVLAGRHSVAAHPVNAQHLARCDDALIFPTSSPQLSLLQFLITDNLHCVIQCLLSF